MGEDEGEYDSKSSSPTLLLRATRDEGLSTKNSKKSSSPALRLEPQGVGDCGVNMVKIKVGKLFL
jgi:hypothetical protein